MHICSEGATMALSLLVQVIHTQMSLLPRLDKNPIQYTLSTAHAEACVEAELSLPSLSPSLSRTVQTEKE